MLCVLQLSFYNRILQISTITETIIFSRPVFVAYDCSFALFPFNKKKLCFIKKQLLTCFQSGTLQQHKETACWSNRWWWTWRPAEGESRLNRFLQSTMVAILGWLILQSKVQIQHVLPIKGEAPRWPRGLLIIGFLVNVKKCKQTQSGTKNILNKNVHNRSGSRL